MVHKPLAFSPESLLMIQAMHFDVAINLDKDPHACAMMNTVNADSKFGFVLQDGKPAPANEFADHKFVTGIFDDANQQNTKSYIEEIFEVCGWQFHGEEYLIDKPSDLHFREARNGLPLVGLNTGCGERWISRRWNDDNWIELIKLLKGKGYAPVLLGGKQEHELNTRLATTSSAMYFGHFNIQKFISLVDACDVVVTTVTMALHVAIALKKQVVLLNNIFNPNEFELYGRGEIVQPSKPCHCFFRGSCANQEYSCMDYITPEMVLNAVLRRATLASQPA
jgi:heptosyltransferase-2